MMSDARYHDKFDTRLRDHVQKQLEKAYVGEVQYDEAGKMVPSSPVIAPEEVEPFDPDGELRISNHIADFQNGPPHEYEQPPENDKDEEEPPKEETSKENVETKQEEQKVDHPPVRRHITSGGTRIKLNNTLEIQVQSYTLLVDGVDIEVFYGSLDKNGRRHTLAPPEVHNFAFAHQGTKTKTISFSDTPYGWDVSVRILSSESRSGNPGGFRVQVSGS
jgi:hypothetical protein